MNIPKKLGNFASVAERADKAHKTEALWRNLLDDCYTYCLPNRNLFSEDSPGAKKMDHIFDSTAVRSIQSGASKLQDSIAPIWKRWATLGPSEEIERMAGFKEFEDKIRKQLEDKTKIIFDYINRSNFSTEFYESCLDLMIGTCTLAIDEEDNNDNPVVFTAIPQKGIAFEEGVNGTVKSHFRKHKVKARNLELKYKGFNASHEVRELINKEPNAEISVNQAIIHLPEDNTYHGLVWVEDEDRYSWHEDYGQSNPWNTSRYTKVSGEIRGRGIAVQMLADIKTLNKMKEFGLQKAAIDLSGLWTGVDDGVFNPYNFTLEPGVVVPVGTNNSQNPSLQRLDTSIDLNLTMFSIEDLTNNIKEAFFEDLRDPAAPVQSATEVAIEARKFAKRVGSAFGRLQTELLIPILNRVAWILQRRGIIEPVKIDGKEISVKFTSPLARAQDMEDLIAVQQAVEFTAATSGPEMVKANFKTEDFGSWSGRITGMAEELIRSAAEKQEVIKAGAQAMQQAQQQESGANQNDMGNPEQQAI